MSRRVRQIPVAWLDTIADVHAGDALTVEVASGPLTQVAWMTFAVPLAGLVGGAWLGGIAAGILGLAPDTASGIAGLGCLALASTIMTRRGGVMVRVLKLTAYRQRTD
jgi:positive regulator of sigma E activity